MLIVCVYVYKIENKSGALLLLKCPIFQVHAQYCKWCNISSAQYFKRMPNIASGAIFQVPNISSACPILQVVQYFKCPIFQAHAQYYKWCNISSAQYFKRMPNIASGAIFQVPNISSACPILQVVQYFKCSIMKPGMCICASIIC